MEEDRTTRVLCNRCGTVTLHRFVGSNAVWGWFDKRPDDSPNRPDEADWSEEYDLLQCCGCDDVCVRRQRHDDAPEDSEPQVYFYPPRLSRRRPKWFSALPLDLVALLDEVYSALAADSRRLALMGARAVIDMVLVEKVGDKGTFPDKLDALESRGFIEAGNRDQLAAAIDAGHAAAHRGYEPSADDIGHVLDIVESLLQSAYVLDDAARGLRQHTPRRYPRGV